MAFFNTCKGRWLVHPYKEDLLLYSYQFDFKLQVVVGRIGADKQRQENLFEFSNIAHCLQVVVDRIEADKQRQENLLEFSNIVHCL
jgi:hypothetical protein